ncbi:hypothetical protein SCHPADRAFT_270563 [Schizopora paradoxa]|uniref:Uncharacterized protein n=1 Tax=Schizopora paradoxa TaxID=27342 RepID=A0A0H2RU05_9AGAM|nr:hypothetical protein SCHPADRAFT_270563 [Schizopora paradoxa]
MLRRSYRNLRADDIRNLRSRPHSIFQLHNLLLSLEMLSRRRVSLRKDLYYYISKSRLDESGSTTSFYTSACMILKKPLLMQLFRLSCNVFSRYLFHNI